MHHHDLEIDQLHAQVQAATDHFFTEPFLERLLFWERLASRLWAMESARNDELRAAGHGTIPSVWRGPADRPPAGVSHPRVLR